MNSVYQRGSVKGFLFTVVLIGAMVAFAVYAYALNTTIVEKFSSRRWDIPARVYSRPLLLQEGETLTPSAVENWLKFLDYSRSQKQQSGTYQKDGDGYIINTRGFDYGNGDKDAGQTLKVQFDNNKIVSLQSTSPSDKGFARLEPIVIGSIHPEAGEDRIIVSLEETPKTLIDALIATEDRGFYEHHGVSVRGIARAILNNSQGGSMQGGSTLTQQLIKNFYLNSERSLKRKVNEAIMAVLLETNYSKDDILAVYLNEINLGQNGNQSINGFGMASRFYFNKPLSEIRLDQQALLVGLAKGASFYNPRKHKERALERRNTVLHNMLVMGKIDEETYKEAIAQKLDVVDDIKRVSIARPKFPDFLDYVRRELNTRYRTQDLQSAGLRIITTLDPIAQTSAEKSFTKLGKLKRTKEGALQGALVSANPSTGEVVALVGSTSDFTGFNRVLDAKRQVGSLLKPVIYLTALETGKYNLASGVQDEAITYRGWTPKNYGGRSHGTVAMLTALANSYNQSAVNTGMDVGLEHFLGYLNNLGITENLPNYPASLLGAVELSPMQILGLYQIFANGGVHSPLHGIDRVIGETGQILEKSQIKKEHRIPTTSAYLINFAMQQVIKEGTAKSAMGLNGKFGKLDLAGKTGTTNDTNDAWFAGYSGNYVAVVWVGYDNNKATGLTGGTGALPIWMDYMNGLPLTPVRFEVPDDIEWGYVEAGTGRLTDEDCENALYIPYKTGTVSNEQSQCSLNRFEEARQAELLAQFGDDAVSFEDIDGASINYDDFQEDTIESDEEQ